MHAAALCIGIQIFQKWYLYETFDQSTSNQVLWRALYLKQNLSFGLVRAVWAV